MGPRKQVEALSDVVEEAHLASLLAVVREQWSAPRMVDERVIAPAELHAARDQSGERARRCCSRRSRLVHESFVPCGGGD